MAEPSTFEVTFKNTDDLDDLTLRRFTVQRGRLAFLPKDDEDSIKGVGIGRASKATSNAFYKAACDNAWIECPTVSRRHAVLSVEKEPPFLSIINVAATHGLSVNGTKIEEGGSQRLKNGDKIQLSGEVRRGTEIIPPRLYEVTFTNTTSQTGAFRVPEEDSEDEDEDEYEDVGVDVMAMHESTESIAESDVANPSDDYDDKAVPDTVQDSMADNMSANFSDIEDEYSEREPDEDLDGPRGWSTDEDVASCYSPPSRMGLTMDNEDDYGENDEMAEEQQDSGDNVKMPYSDTNRPSLADAEGPYLDPAWAFSAVPKHGTNFFDYGPPPTAVSVGNSATVPAPSMSFEKILNSPIVSDPMIVDTAPLANDWPELHSYTAAAPQSMRSGTNNIMGHWDLTAQPVNDYNEGPFAPSRANMFCQEQVPVKKSGISINDIVEQSDEQPLRPQKRKASVMEDTQPPVTEAYVIRMEMTEAPVERSEILVNRPDEVVSSSAAVEAEASARPAKKVKIDEAVIATRARIVAPKRRGIQRVKGALVTAARLSATALVGGVGVFLALAFYPEA